MLSRYDLVYVKAGLPFVTMDIALFVEHIEEMKEMVHWEPTVKDGIKYKDEQCSDKDFIQHFKDKEEWKAHITDKKGSFLQTLFLDGIFIKENLEGTIMSDDYEAIEQN